MEGIENTVTQEKLLFAQFKKRINSEAARAQIKKLEYNLTDFTVSSASVKSACADARTLGIGGICVQPCYVKICASYLGLPRACRLIAVIDCPHGGSTLDIKVKAVKRAIKDGADEVEVAAPLSRIREGNYGYVKREFKKLRSASKKRSLRIVVDCAYLTKDEIRKVSAVAADCGVNSIKTSAGTTSGTHGLEAIAEIKTAVGDRCTVKAEGVATVLDMSNAIDMGAGVIGSRGAADLARTVMTATENDFV